LLLAAGGVNYDWFPVKMGVRGSTSVKDFTRKSYAVKVRKANSTASSKVQFLGEQNAVCLQSNVGQPANTAVY
jgi:hypothetical protein